MKLLRDSFTARQMRARPLATFSVAYLLGLIAAFKWRPALAACVGAALAVLAGYAAIRIHGRRMAALLMLFALLAGMARMVWHLQSIPQVHTQYSVQLVGRIVSEPYTNPNTGRVISRFRLESIDGDPSELVVRLYLRGDAEALKAIEYGQQLSTVAHIWESDPVTNPYEFDFRLYLQRNGMPAYATAKIEDVQILSATQDLNSAFIHLRKVISTRIDALFPQNAGLVRALILGDRTQMSEEMREALNETGTAHLVAISGLHVTTLAMMLSVLFRRILPRKAADALTLALLIFYGGLIGFGASFVRALIMFAIFSFAPIAGYPSDGITRLCAAMLGMLIVNPMDILDGGFVLSFSASAGIILLNQPLSALFGVKRLLNFRPPANPIARLARRAAAYFPGLLCTTIAAQLATLPAVIAYFGVQSVVSVPINLICVPLCMLGFPIALAALMISVFSMPAAVIIAACAEGLFTLMVDMARWGATLPVTGVRIGRYPAPLIFAHGAVMLAASNLSRMAECRRRFIPLLLVLLAGVSTAMTYVTSLGFSIVFLDAGQADCAIVRTQGHTYMIDVGDTYTPAGDYLSATCLRLDGIFLSHPHQDHAGGLEDVLEAIRPEVIYVPEGWFDYEDISQAVLDGMAMAEEMDIPIVELRAGDSMALSRDTCLTVHSPAAGQRPREVNDLSLLVSVTYGNQTALFTGDLSADGEPQAVPDADILKVAHHGSAKGTSADFLEMTTPETAVICVGENNFGHPSPDTLEKLDAAGARILRTDRCGAILMKLRPDDTWRIETYLPMEESYDLE